MKLVITIKETTNHCGVNHPELCTWNCQYREYNPNRHPCTIYPSSLENQEKLTENQK